MPRQKFFGYWVVIYCFMLMFLIFTMIKSLHSLFLVPVTESLQMERRAFSLVFTITGISVALALPIISKLLNRYPVKRVISVCVLLASCGFASFALAKTSWQFYIIAVIVGVGTAGCTNVVIALLINNWFIDHKGLALGIAFTGSGFGAAILAPVLTTLLTQYGWQLTYLFCGILMGVICFPLTWLLAYKKPSEKKQQPYQDLKGNRAEQCIKVDVGPELQEIRMKPFFWIYLLAIFLCSVAVGGVHMHIPAYLTDIGHSAAFVSFVYSTQAICLIGGKVLLGMIFDARGSKMGILFLGFSFCLALICFTMAKEPILAIAFALSYGCGATFSSVGVSYLTSSFFGQKGYAEILSIANIFYVLGAAIGPLISGMVYDSMGSYQTIWQVYCVLFAFASVLLWMVKSYLEKDLQEQWC